MNIKNLIKKSLDFTIKRVAEIVGILFILISVLLLISLLSYSSEDPNFIFTENTEIKNILGYRGSYISDLFFQSVGLVSFLISFTIFFTGINLIKNPEIKNYPTTSILKETGFKVKKYDLIKNIEKNYIKNLKLFA